MHRIKILLGYVRYFFHIIAYTISSSKTLIQQDVMNKFGRGYFELSMLILLLYDPYFRVIFYSRLGIGKTRFLRLCAKPAADFTIDCKSVGGGLKASHAFATILYAKSIGNNLSVRQSTTIGNKIDGGGNLLPVLGDNVYLGANVVIIGNVKIGNNVIVGAGSVVVKDIPENCIVAGNPAKIIKMRDNIVVNQRNVSCCP